MDLRQIEAFAAVISTGSITGAARLLGRSQPALTRLIQDLEETVGFPVLHRSGPRITPTDQGLRLHAEIEPVLGWLRRLGERASAIAGDKPASLDIAAIASFGAGLLPEALRRLNASTLPEHIHIRTAAAEQVVQTVATHAAEIGITSLPVDHPALEIHWIGEAPCVVAVRADDPLSALDRVPLSAFQERRLITMANPFRWRRRVDAALDAAGIRPAGVVDTNTSSTALMLARSGLGAAILEPVIAYGMPLEDVAIRPLDAPISFLWAVITPAGRPLARHVEGLIDALEMTGRETLPGFVKHPANARERLIGELPKPPAIRSVGRGT